MDVLSVFAILLIIIIVFFRKEIENGFRTIQTLRGSTNQSLTSILMELTIYYLRSKFSTLFSSGLVFRNSYYVDISYYDGNNCYTVRFPKQRGPKPFLHVSDGEEKDVTHMICRFIGPHNNFHGIPTTPSMLGFTELHFTRRDSTIQVFKDTEQIIF